MDQQIPRAFAIMKENRVTLFESGILGHVIGSLIDHDLTDLEILEIVGQFCSAIRSAAKDPNVLEHIRKQNERLGRHFEA